MPCVQYERFRTCVRVVAARGKMVDIENLTGL